ncbi:MAG: choice-of-anchor tandem repeat GloVer-containing protein [Rhizomicrobium sp.]
MRKIFQNAVALAALGTAALCGSLGAAYADSESVIYSFQGGSDGAFPVYALNYAGGMLYGTTPQGGAGCGCGTLFTSTLGGVESVVYAFKGGKNGNFPAGEPLFVGGKLYGVTQYGGDASCNPGGCGTIYSVTPAGKHKLLYSFKGGSDGAFPIRALLDSSGDLYGVTQWGGGAGSCTYDTTIAGCGTVYKSTLAGALSPVYAFGTATHDGIEPESPMRQIGSAFYGTTSDGGTPITGNYSLWGTVYQVTPAGAETVIYSFQGGSDGENPSADIIKVGANYYGTTYYGGGKGCIVEGNASSGCGTVYKLTPPSTPTGAWTEKVIYAFTGGADGGNPSSTLLEVGGKLYGTTFDGGTGPCSGTGTTGCGTVFQITTAGKETVLHSFADGSDGAYPGSRLIDIGGTLYGMTRNGGSGSTGVCAGQGCGTIYTIAP